MKINFCSTHPLRISQNINNNIPIPWNLSGIIGSCGVIELIKITTATKNGIINVR